MQFGVLGSLEVVDRGVAVPVKGTKQRAVLAYLLLHANQVVATSRLLKALWPDEVPSTARKMVQNAVSGLRNVLASHADGERSALLLTHAPGYVLRVPPEQIDLCRFEGLAQAARAGLADGRTDQAAQALREALRLWRGPVLADLAEAGVRWPELTKVRDMRVGVMEDYFDIELERARHAEVLPDLEQLFLAEPHRERLCRQLMTALYRAGRHVDALQVYRRTRAAMAEDLGLEPGRELRELERAILEHDEEALSPGAPARVADRVRVAPVPVAEPSAGVVRPAAAAVPGVAPGAVAERRLVSVVAVALRQDADRDPEEVEQSLVEIAGAVRDEVERAGGAVIGSTGSVLLSVFGVPRTHDDDVVRATRAALAIRDRLLGAVGSGPDFRLAVATGEVLAKFPVAGGATPTIAGTVVDTCAQMTNAARRGTVWACEVTRQASASLIAYAERSDAAAMWRAESVRDTPVPAPQRHVRTPFLGRELDLDLLHRMLNQAELHARPQLLTLLGEAGIGKSRLVREFVESLPEGDDGTGPLVHTTRVPALCDDVAVRVLADVLRGCLVRRDGDPAAAVDELVGPGEQADSLVSRLAPLLAPSPAGIDLEEAFYALRAVLEAKAAQRPLVLVFEDLHLADERLLDLVARLSRGFGPAPLLVVATARPELLTAHPGWHGTVRNATTVTLEPLPDTAVEALLDSLLPAGHDGVRTEQLRRSVLTKVSGNPLFAVEYATAIRDGRLQDELPPDQVRRVLAARLTALSPEEKAVLKDAAVLGEMITAAGIAAVGGYGEHQVDAVARCLERLERGQLLRRAPYRDPAEGPTYEFTQILVRDISYLELPHTQRAAKHRNAASWIDGLSSARGGQWDAHHPLRRHHHRHVTAAVGRRTAPRSLVADSPSRALVGA
ncbi:BTAD domain-containing putative transcriptional regulator, partial [Saccharothrix sp. Mg75]|uniref:BTAD domain-containing putative transcriptional regulator n=1 Tax=Saccharothrix sp. Mg75 TaxID=3445357 RepID=UPI003EEA5C47